MWEARSDSHTVTIQWVRMGVDPLLCVCTNIVTIILPLVEACSLKDHMYNYLTNLTDRETGMRDETRGTRMNRGVSEM